MLRGESILIYALSFFQRHIDRSGRRANRCHPWSQTSHCNALHVGQRTSPERSSSAEEARSFSGGSYSILFVVILPSLTTIEVDQSTDSLPLGPLIVVVNFLSSSRPLATLVL